MAIDLFPSEQIVGVFRGFRDGGLEFHADLVLPYRNDFQSIPMHGQFLLVQLETSREAVLGRIASFSSGGKLSSGSGEEFNVRAMREGRQVPEDLREEYLKYNVNIRVLGILRSNASQSLTFVPSHRRLPHVGSPVAFPSSEVLRHITGSAMEGAPLGHFALGEYIYSGSSNEIEVMDWMQIKQPEVTIRFPVENLVSRRSFIFARAGFGKSNLNKLLFSHLYAGTPTVVKRGQRRVPVGTIIFDPDGEYFWPDDKGRPGLCDVPALQDTLVVFTSRKGPSPFYQSFVAGGIRLDIRRLKPSDVIAITLSAERQDQQNVRKLRALSTERWERLVNLVATHGHQSPLEEIAEIVQLDYGQQNLEALAVRANMVAVIHALHDKSSQLMDKLLEALAKGKLCVVDVSQMRSGQALMLSGLILRRIFDRNQEEFTAAEPKTIPTIAVIEEAQSVLNDHATAAEPYIAWVKEGRKYDLGAVLVTQQPGSIPWEILSQGDNWFIFHLLSTTDLTNLKRANAHFSEDLLSALLNEPIAGQGVYWSSVGGTQYPIPVRTLSFERMFPVRDPDYSLGPAETYASALRQKYLQANAELIQTLAGLSANGTKERTVDDSGAIEESEAPDILSLQRQIAVETLARNSDVMGQLFRKGIPWFVLINTLEEALPETIENRNEIARGLVRDALHQIVTVTHHKRWATEKRESKAGHQVLYVLVAGDEL